MFQTERMYTYIGSIGRWFSTEGSSVSPRGHLATSDYHSWEMLLSSYIEQDSPQTKNNLAQNADGARVGKPCCRLDQSIHNFIHSRAVEAFCNVNVKCVSM